MHCNLHTGQERQVLEGAKHVSCTIEMASTTRQWDCAVIDEIQVGFAFCVLRLKNVIYGCSMAHMSTLIAMCVAAVMYRTSLAYDGTSLYELAGEHAKLNLQFGASSSFVCILLSNTWLLC